MEDMVEKCQYLGLEFFHLEKLVSEKTVSKYNNKYITDYYHNNSNTKSIK